MLGLGLGLSLSGGGGGGGGIAFVAANSSATSGGSWPAGAIGDFLFGSAQQTTGGAVAPSVPSGTGFTTPTGSDDITPNVAGGNQGASAAYQFLSTADAASGGTWTNGNSRIYSRYSGVNVTTPLLSLKWATGSGGDILFPALSHSDPRAWVLLFWRTANDVAVAPPGFTLREVGTRRGLYDAPMATFAGLSVTPIGVVSQWVAGAAAIKAA